MVKCENALSINVEYSQKWNTQYEGRGDKNQSGLKPMVKHNMGYTKLTCHLHWNEMFTICRLICHLYPVNICHLYPVNI
jgi:hypothetical protein